MRISRRPLHVVAAVLISACQTSVANNNVLGSGVISGRYEATPKPSGIRRPAIDLYIDRLDYVDAGTKIDYVTEFGQAIQIRRDRGFAVMNTPLIAPIGPFENRQNGALICSARRVGRIFDVACVMPNGKLLNSAYDRMNGILWFDYFCNSSDSDICRYHFMSGMPFLSPKMIRRLNESR